jgi:hypothetical protein
VSHSKLTRRTYVFANRGGRATRNVAVTYFYTGYVVLIPHMQKAFIYSLGLGFMARWLSTPPLTTYFISLMP